MAPEMILRKGYGKAVDWWSMGALVYEMTAGYPPFQGKTPKDLNRKILNERVSLPKWLSPTAHQVSVLSHAVSGASHRRALSRFCKDIPSLG